jgi:hypothetical protein
MLYIRIYTTNTTTHLSAMCQIQKQMHMFLDPEFDQHVHFNYTVSVLRDNMKDYNINRAKLVSSHTHHTFQSIRTHV